MGFDIEEEFRRPVVLESLNARFLDVPSCVTENCRRVQPRFDTILFPSLYSKTAMTHAF